MTKEFQEMVDRLAKARNFKEGAFLLLTRLPDESDSSATMKGNSNVLFEGIAVALVELLKQYNDNDCQTMCDIIIKIISDEQARRFQQGPVSEVAE